MRHDGRDGDRQPGDGGIESLGDADRDGTMICRVAEVREDIDQAGDRPEQTEQGSDRDHDLQQGDPRLELDDLLARARLDRARSPFPVRVLIGECDETEPPERRAG